MILVAIAKNDSSKNVALFALGEYAKIEGAEINADCAYRHRDDGSPYFEGSDLRVSVSHSGEYVVAAVSNENVGIDVQETKDLDFAVISQRFGINAVDKKEFFRAFCSAEAYAKATGTPLFSAIKKAVPYDTVTYDFISGYMLALYAPNGASPIFLIKFD